MNNASVEPSTASNDAPSGRLGWSGKLFVNKFVNDIDNLWAENGLLKLLALLSFLASLVLSTTVWVQAQNTRVIVVPFASGSPDLLIVGDRPSSEYLSAISRNIVTLTGTFTAATAEYQFTEVLKYAHPSAFVEMRDKWNGMVQSLRQYREATFATYVIPPQPIEIYGDRILVPAMRTRFVGDKVREETGQVEIKYTVENGRFWLLSVDFLVKGGRPDAN